MSAAPAAAAGRHPVALALAVSGLLAAAYLIWQPPTLDLAAQTFRAELAERDGFVVWSEAWYSGFTVPGYSVLYPPLGALVGPVWLGAICAVAAAALFAAIAHRAFGEQALAGIGWFSVAAIVAPLGGRTTFALGLVAGLAALLALQRGRPGLGALAGIAAALASPVAGLFTALAAAAVALAARFPLGDPAPAESRPRSTYAGAAAVAAAAAAGTLALALAFPTDGYQPFAASAFVWIPLVCGAALLLLPPEQRALRWGALLYLLLGLAALLVDTPLGGNAVRLGSTFAGPVLALVLIRRRPLLLVLLAVPLLWWQWTATVRDVAAAAGDPSTEQAYYEPLIERIEAEAGPGPVRVEVPPTRNRWEAAHLAERIPIARGWLRQLESDDFELFTGGRLDPTAYQQWLYEHGVSYVALPAVELDYLAEDEAELLEADGLPYLREVWSSPEWTLWQVRSADGTRPPEWAALATGRARLGELGSDGFRVRVPRPGEYLLRIRYSPYLEISSGRGCIEDAGDASTRLTVPPAGEGPVEPETIEVEASLSLAGIAGRDRFCSEGWTARR